jgi:uncharacterized surface protein with fasciclin (FAS1) repeats
MKRSSEMTIDKPNRFKHSGLEPTHFGGIRRQPHALSRRTALACLGLSIAALPIQLRAQQSGSQNAWDILAADPQFSDAVELFKYSGLVQYVQTDSFTAFVPTNAAFAKNPEVLPSLLRGKNRAFPDTTLAVNFVRSHAIQDMHPLSEFSGRYETLTAISGNPLTVDGRTPGVYVVTWISVASKLATAHVVDKPIVATNALIYPVDTVVLT